MAGVRSIAESVAVPAPLGSPPSVSVIVAAYNAAATLTDCLDSLLRLEYPGPLELLCVDNASTDATPRLLAAYHGRITVLRETTRGPAAARNAGLRHATGAVVALTDADCVVDRHWLASLVSPLHDPAVGIVGGRILSKRPRNSIEAFGEYIHDHHRAINELNPPYVITMNWAARMDVLRAVGHFNEELLRGSDADFAFRATQAGYRFAYMPTAIIFHQNERTPWGLTREGYVHGYHAVKLLRLHAAFLDQIRKSARAGKSQQPSAAAPPDVLWFRLFHLGKRIGRWHALRNQPL